MRDDNTRGRGGNSSTGTGTSRRNFLKATAGTGTIAAGFGGGVVGTAAADGIDTPWLSVDGNLVKDPMGNEVILRGVNIADPKRINRTAPARGKTAEQVVEAATSDEKGWHSRFIRIPVQPWDIAEHPPVPVAGSGDSSPSDFVEVSGENAYGYYEPPLFTVDELESYVESHLKPVVEACVERDVYCIVDFHRHWGQGELSWATLNEYENPVGPNPDLDTEVRRFWKTVAPHFADTPNVLFEVYNEPTMPGWGPEETIWKGWKAVAQPWVDIIRERAPRNLILIGNPRWSRMVWGVNIEEFDGDNLGYTYHIYPGHAVTDFDDDTGNAWEKVPLFVTEWGFEPGRCDYICGNEKRFGDPFKQWADERPVHWTAWCFDPVWLPATMRRGFDTSDTTDAVGDPYSGDIPEHCTDLPCEWETRYEDGSAAGRLVRDWLAERRNDDVPQVDYDPRPPEVPPNLSVENVGQTSIEVDWDDAVDPGDSPLSGYNVYLDGDLSTQVSADTTAATLSELLSDTTYEVGVTGFDVAGNEGEAATVTATTEAFDDSTAPTVPSGLSVAAESHVSLTVSWDGVADTGPSGLHHYNVYVDGSVDQHVAAGTTEATIEDLTPDTAHDVAVSAVDTSQNESERSDSLSTRTEVDRPGSDALVLFDFADGDGWPGGNEHGQWIGSSGFSPEHADGRLTLTWDGNGWLGCKVPSGVSNYQYLKLRLRGGSGGEGSTLSLDFAGVTGPLADYGEVGTRTSLVTVDLAAAGATLSDPGQFRLNAAGSGTVDLDAVWLDNDAPGGDTGDVTAPTAPTSLAQTDAGTTSVTVSWESSSDTGGSGLDHYMVAVADRETTVAAGTTQATVAELAADTGYDVSVAAVDGAGNRSDPATVTVQTDPGDGETDVEPIDGTVPQDIDGDGTYEDLNANDEVDFDDVVIYFTHMSDPTMTDHVAAYDYNGNSEIDFDDVVSLFQDVE